MVPSSPSNSGFAIKARNHLLIALGGALTLFCLNFGCGPSTPDLSQASRNVSNPEADFDWFIKRLEHALESFSPSGTLGLRAKRELEYELIPPKDSQSNYTARVTITSKTYYKPEYQPIEQPQSDESEQPDDPLAYDSILSDNPLENPLDNPDLPLPKFPTKEQTTMRASVPMPYTGSKEIFELAYLEGRWQLIAPPESERAQNWFNYALENMEAGG